jgi:hypothetical protein
MIKAIKKQKVGELHENEHLYFNIIAFSGCRNRMELEEAIGF